MPFQTVQDDKNNRDENKKTNLKTEIRSIWLGLCDLFQTFQELDEVKDKPADIQAVREVLEDI